MLSERWRASWPVVAAIAVVATLSLLTVAVMSSLGGEDDRATGAVGGPTTTTTEAARRAAPRSTTTIPAPEVLGETTQRTPDGDAAGTVSPPVGAPAPAPAPAPAAPAPAPPPSPSPSPSPTTTTTTTPPTTTTTTPPTTVCRNSTDPSCGPFSWDPEPVARDVELHAVSTPDTATVGEPVTFVVEYVDPAGPRAEGACLNWWVSDPEVVNVSSCEVLATDCARTGPHDPPAPSDERLRVQRTIEFQTPGEHEVTLSGNIATHLADGCESPYANTLSRTFTIVVS